MFGKSFLYVFCFTFFFVFAVPVHAATYYVAKDGDDGDPGTEAEPFLTVTTGVGVLTAGDTLYVKAGTYTEALQDVIPSGTSWANPVTVAAFAGDSPILKPSATNRVLYFGAGDDSYIVIDGFVLDSTNVIFETVKITTGSNHIRIKNTEIKNSPGSGILVTQAGSGDNEFLDLTIHNNGTTGFHHGIYVQTDDNLISGNEIYSNSGHGIHLFNGDPDNNIIRNNNVHSNLDRGIGVYIGSDNVIYNNISRNQIRGIQIGDAAISTGVYNNTVYANSAVGIFFEGNSESTTLYNNVVVNNNIGISVNSGATLVTIKNNLSIENPTNYTDASSGATLADNLFGTTDDPKFVDASSNNFHLKASSPAVNTGITVATVTNDYDAIARPQGSAYDMGAFEYVAPTADVTSEGATPGERDFSITTTRFGSTVSDSSPTVKQYRTTTGNTYISGFQSDVGNILGFSGRASPNSLVSVRLENSSGKITPGVTKVGLDGIWTWVPPLSLASGNYTGTFIVQDTKGNTGSTTLEFTIGARSEPLISVPSLQITSSKFNIIEIIVSFVNNAFQQLFVVQSPLLLF